MKIFNLLPLFVAATFAVEDTYIWVVEPTSNFGDFVDITVDQSDGGGVTRGLLKFSAEELPSGLLLGASLYIYANSDTSDGTISMHRMITEWDENGVTWNTFGSMVGAVAGPGPIAGVDYEETASVTFTGELDDQYYRIDVTDDVAFWANGGINQGWIFINNSTDGWDWDSAETDRPPMLCPCARFQVVCRLLNNAACFPW